MNKLLIGKWSHEDAKSKFKKVTTYQNEGRFEFTSTLGVGKEAIEVTVTGIWKVAKGEIVHTTVMKTSEPELLEVGKILKEKVVFLDEKSFKYKSDRGAEIEYKRLK